MKTWLAEVVLGAIWFGACVVMGCCLALSSRADEQMETLIEEEEHADY